MLRKTLIAAAVILLLGSARAEDRRNDKSMLVVMTLNAEFLWNGVAPEEGQVRFPWKFSQTEAEEHMQKVAELITRSNPDIVNLVEVENLEALKLLTISSSVVAAMFLTWSREKTLIRGRMLHSLRELIPKMNRFNVMTGKVRAAT